MVRGEGTPQYYSPFVKGDLYIKIDVRFPQNNWINPDKLSELEDLPSRPEVQNIIGDTEEAELRNSTALGAREAGRGAKPIVTAPMRKAGAEMDQERSVPISKPHPCALVGFQRSSWKVWSI